MRPRTLLEKTGGFTGRLVLNIFLIFWAVAVIYPLLWMVISSFKDTNGIYLSTWSLPDVLHLEGGSAYFFEVKAPGGRATPLQVATLEQLAQAGAVAALVRSVADVKAILGGDVHAV